MKSVDVILSYRSREQAEERQRVQIPLYAEPPAPSLPPEPETVVDPLDGYSVVVDFNL